MKQRLSELIFCVALICAVLKREKVDGANLKASQKACNTYTVQPGKATKILFQVSLSFAKYLFS
jgi:hypothetical protein